MIIAPCLLSLWSDGFAASRGVFRALCALHKSRLGDCSAAWQLGHKSFLPVELPSVCALFASPLSKALPRPP
jgi:hypothetical protein